MEAGPNESQLTGNFDPNESSNHYVADGDPKSPTGGTGAQGASHYTQMMQEPNAQMRGSIKKDNRSSNRRSGKPIAPESTQNCCSGCTLF